MEKREVLRPYKKQRLAFEGVLIHVIPPDRKNSYMHGLVFASVYAPNEGFEIDHVIIEMERSAFRYGKMELFKRYCFTASVNNYYKTGPILGVQVQQECFMLEKINPFKIYETEESRCAQPTLYIQTRIQNVLRSKNQNAQIRYTEDELLDIVTTMPNDGSVEQFMTVYTKSHQVTKVDSYDIIRAVYQ